MSLIVETLEKIQRDQLRCEGLLPPNLYATDEDEGENEKKNMFISKRLIILLLVLFILGLLSLAGTFFLNNMGGISPVISYSDDDRDNQPPPPMPEQSMKEQIKKLQAKQPLTNEKIIKQDKPKPIQKEAIKQKPKEQPNNVAKKTAQNQNIKKKKEKTKPQKKIEKKVVKSKPKKVAKHTTPKHKVSSKKTHKKVVKHNPKKTKHRIKKVDEKAFWKHVNLAVAYLNEGNYDRAINEYLEALKYKEDKKLLENLLILLIKRGKIKTAEELVKEYDIASDDSLMFKFIIGLLKYRYINVAKRYIDSYKPKEKPYLSAFLKGLYYEMKGDLDNALVYYREAYNNSEYDPLIFYSYARILELKNKYKEALSVYDRIYKFSNNKKLKEIALERIQILEGLLREM